DTYRMDPENAWQRLKTRVRKPKELAVLIEVAAWREREAQSRDVPRSRVLKDEAIADISVQAPTTTDKLKSLRSLPRGFERSRWGEAIVAAVARGLARDVKTLPCQVRPQSSANGAAVVELLKVLLRMISERHHVAAKVIATVDDLEHAQPVQNPFAGQRREFAGQPQCKPVPLHRERRPRQHFGHGRGNDIGEPQRRAEHARAVEPARRGKLAQPRRQLVVHYQSDVAVKYGEGQIGAARMVDRGEAAMGNDIERLLAAIIGMRTPADIGQQAGGVTKPAFLARFIEAGGGHETVGPYDQLFAVARRARAQSVETACRFDERILLLVLLFEQRIEQALAHAERGEHHLARLADTQDIFEHQRRVSEQRPP